MITEGDMDVCVVGLGKLGLPLAVQIAQMGHRVRGADIDQRAVDLINAGQEPFPGEIELPGLLAEVVADGRLTASTDTTGEVAQSQAVVVIVPLIVDPDRNPVFTALDAATNDIGPGLQPGTLVSYETTLPVGTSRGRFGPRLAELSGLTVGDDLFVVHSPERVFTGRVFADLRRYPKLVGGVTAACTSAGVAFYEQVLTFDERPDLERPNGVWAMANAETAELTKLAETTYRNVNIGFANELARYSERSGIDVHDVIGAANSQVFSHIHQPGASVGGHCIPVYPHFYLYGDDEAVIPKISVEVNEAMPAHLASTLAESIDGGLAGRTVAVLGLSYRPGVKEEAFSGTYPLVEALEAAGATVVVDDPMYTDDELAAHGFTPLTATDAVTGVVVHTAHDDYLQLGPDQFPAVECVVDGRNVIDPDKWPGVTVRTIGKAPGLS